MSIASSCTSCALHNLPVGLFATILEKYLDETDWSKLDIAFCSSRNELRNLFLEALRSVKLNIHNRFDTWTPRIEKGAQKWITARGIRIISWEEFYLNDNRLIDIVSANNYITSLDLRNCKNISDAGITAVAFWLNSNLKELNLAYCNKLTDLSVLAISTGAKNLESLEVTFCEGITDKSLEAISSSLPKLHKLSISGAEISDTGIGYLGNGCLQNLYELDIFYCSNLTDDGFTAIAKGNLHNLQKLNITGHTSCSDLNMKALASGNLKNLKTLSISGVFSGSGLANIACGMPTLVSLSVSSNEMITNADEGLNAIFTNLVNLQELYISECDATDAGFAPLARSEVFRGEIKYALSSLTIRSSYIADIGLMIIVKGLSNLKQLVIRDSYVSDTGLIELAALGSSGLHLESLSVSRCSCIAGVGIIPVMTKLPSLKSLNISHTNIDDEVVFAIAKSCGSSSVDTLKLRDVPVSDTGLCALVYGLRSLKSIEILTEMSYEEYEDENDLPHVFSLEIVQTLDVHFPGLLYCAD